jgi:hypothetical protein
MGKEGHMGAIVLPLLLVPVVLVVAGLVGLACGGDTAQRTARPSEEELLEQQLRPAMEELYREAFEVGYTYCRTHEIRRPTADEKQAWSMSGASAALLRAVA